MQVDVFRVPGIDNPDIAQLLANDIVGYLRRHGSAFFLVFIVQNSDRNRGGMMTEQFRDTVFQRCPRVIDLVDQQDPLSSQLVFSLFDPLNLAGKFGWLVVGVIVRDADGENGLAQKGSDDAGGDKAAGSYGNDDIRLEIAGCNLFRHAFGCLVDFLIGKIALFHGRILKPAGHFCNPGSRILSNCASARLTIKLIMIININMNEREIFTSFLKRKGLKMTQPRETVLQAFLAHEGHLTTEDILHASRMIDASIGQATVFRTMKLIAEAGLARDACQDDGPRKYEHAYLHSHHDHLHCIGCGKVIEFFDPDIEQAQEAIFKQYGFTAIGHRMELQGLCAECSAQQDKTRTQP